MEAFYDWIRNLIGYFLFLSILNNLLPGKKYAKYIHLFSGTILILLLLQPLMGGLRVEDKIAQYYGAFVFRSQAEDLQQEILGVESRRLEQIIARYEHAVMQDVTQMAMDEGWNVQSCRVQIGEDEGTEQFGTVTGIWLTVSERIPSLQKKESLQSVRPIDPVWIGDREAQQEEAPAAEAGTGAIDSGNSGDTAKLLRKIAAYYSLEEAYVEIHVLEEER